MATESTFWEKRRLRTLRKSDVCAYWAFSVVVAIACFSAMAALAEGSPGSEIAALAYDPVQVSVASGESVRQDGCVAVASEGCVEKVGEGSWTLPLSFLPQPWNASFSVREGTMKIVSGQAGECLDAAPDGLSAGISAKALLWLDAKDAEPSHIVKDGDGVSVWFDRRESTEVASPKHCRARAYAAYTESLPQSGNLYGSVPSVYFGGYGSGVSMEFVLPSGDRFSERSSQRSVCHVFAVHAPVDSYGTIFGTYGSLPTPFAIDRPAVGVGYYWSSTTTRSPMSNGRTYLDGERIDGTLTQVRAGLQLLEAERHHDADSVVNGLFAANMASKAGGDWICEIIAFTNRLTEAERLEVTSYLMRKWLPDVSGRTVAANVEKGARLDIEMQSSDFGGQYLALKGSGAVRLSGENPITPFSLDSLMFSGSVAVDAKRVVFRSPVSLLLDSGGKVTVSETVGGTEMSLDEGTPGTLVKAGHGRLETASIPNGVRNVKVESGTLAVRIRSSAVDDDDLREEILVRDGGFEESLPLFDGLAEGDGVLPTDSLKLENCGWKGVWNYGSSGKVMNWGRWTGKSANMDSATRNVWGILAKPPEGECALILRIQNKTSPDAIVRSSTLGLEAGVYELRCFICGRQNANYLGQIFRASLVSAASPYSAIAHFGDVMFTDLNGYTEVRLRTEIAEASEAMIELRSLSGRDGLIIVDGVRLFRVTPSAGSLAKWKIPGGDFETASVPQGIAAYRFSAEHGHENWTFSQAAGWTPAMSADVGITTICTTNASTAAGGGNGCYYNNSRRPATGAMQLCFAASGASASTTFYPPAGTWQLQACLAQFGSYGCNPKISAKVEIGGVETALGTVAAKTRLMKTFAWPRSFEVPEGASVRLTLTAEGMTRYFTLYAHGLLVDDLFLARATALDLFRGGGCEYVEPASGSFVLKYLPASDFGGLSGICRIRNPSEAPEVFGAATVDGERMVAIENLSALYEDVFFPFPGRYRISLYVHSRINPPVQFGDNPLRVWIADGDVTNEVGRIQTTNSEWALKALEFDVASPGTRRVAIQGCSNPSDGSWYREALVDAISIRQIVESPARCMAPPFPQESRISVAEGAVLETCFDGTNVVRGITLGEERCSGVVNVSDRPGQLSGKGVFKIVPFGTVVSLR